MLLPMRFDLDDLRAFAAVAELTSFRAAAEAIHLSQPALSRRIEKLERALGARLVDRSTHHVALTPVGRQFETTVRRLLQDLDTAVLGLSDTVGVAVAEVRIACVRSLVARYLAPALVACRLRFPGLRMQLTDAGGNEVLLAVLQGEADFGLSFVGRQTAGIDFQPLFNDPYVAICRADHPLARRRRVAWAELFEHDYVALTRENGSRLLLDLALAGVGLRGRPLLEVRHVSTLLSLVEAGLGVAAVPRIALPPPRAGTLRAIALADPAVSREFGLVRRRPLKLAPAAQRVYDFLTTWPVDGARPLS
jgi:DNA-binding transcriptional LysR family regulator